MTITCSSVLKSKNFLDFPVKPLRKLAQWGLFKTKHIRMSTRDIATENTTNSSSSSFHDVLKKIIQTFLRVTGGLHHLKPLWNADIQWFHRALYITLGLIGSLRICSQRIQQKTSNKIGISVNHKVVQQWSTRSTLIMTWVKIISCIHDIYCMYLYIYINIIHTHTV